MLTHLTETTGTVKGTQEVKDFLSMCYSKFNEVRKTDWTKDNVKADYLQYTLLTNNRISVFLSNCPVS